MQLPFGRPKRHHVVIIGSGFGGLFAAKALRREKVAVTVLARTTHHLFQPLLYQVATGILSEGEIAPVTREILRSQRNARVIQALVEDIDVERKVVKARSQDKDLEVAYDSLIVAAGAGQSYFGHDEFATFAPGMKSLDDALELRARIFGAFELAEVATDQAEIDRLLTFVVVGAGPTGVEMAGQIRELSAHTLRHEFRHIDPAQARVILLDGADQLLGAFGKSLGKKAQRALEDMGVEIQLGAIVSDVTEDGVTVKRKDGSEDFIPCSCKVWAAGVQANPLGKTLAEQTGVELDRAGRVKVLPDLTLPGHPEIFVVGDMAYVEGVPGVAQGAIQEARYAVRRIAERLRPALEPTAVVVSTEGDGSGVGAGDPGYRLEPAVVPEPKPFSYFDKGSMATISRFNAVVSVGPLRVSGFLAWLMWLGLHLLYIAGFKQRVSTLVRWGITFVSNGRSERATTRQQLAGRLALEQFGRRVSASLLRGERPPLEREPSREGTPRAGA